MNQGVMNDREMWVRPDQIIRSGWVPIELCVRGDLEPKAIGDIEKKARRFVWMGDCQSWPPPHGYWREDGRFVVCDGQHEYIAALSQGKKEIFVAWIAPREDVINGE